MFKFFIQPADQLLSAARRPDEHRAGAPSFKTFVAVTGDFREVGNAGQDVIERDGQDRSIRAARRIPQVTVAGAMVCCGPRSRRR